MKKEIISKLSSLEYLVCPTVGCPNLLTKIKGDLQTCEVCSKSFCLNCQQRAHIGTCAVYVVFRLTLMNSDEFGRISNAFRQPSTYRFWKVVRNYLRAVKVPVMERTRRVDAPSIFWNFITRFSRGDKPFLVHRTKTKNYLTESTYGRTKSVSWFN